MKKLINLSLIVLTLAISSCVSQKGDKDSLFVPNTPDSTDGSNTKLQSLINFKVAINEDRHHVISWVTPSTYLGRELEIFLYRIEGDASVFKLPDPTDPYVFAELYLVKKNILPIKDIAITSLVDDSYFEADTDYTYYGYVRVGKDWSKPVQFTIHVNQASDNSQIPLPSNFWSNLRYSYGDKTTESSYVYSENFGEGLSSIGKPSSKCVASNSGSYLYCLDTPRNRIMIYKSDMLVACDGMTDPDFYALCVSIYSSYPYSSFGVIGQESFETKFKCGESGNPLGMDRCLNEPRGISILDGNLVVSDSGNNRILIYNGLPKYGCYNFLDMLGTPSTKDCTPSRVIGKKNIFDSASYDLENDGVSSLNNPTGVASKNGNLYIADTGNNRVVVAKNYLVSESFECTASNWKTSKCRFFTVLGQPDFNTNEDFKTKYYLNEITYDFANKNLSDMGAFLNKHYANPTEIKFFGNQNNSMMIVSNENFSDQNTDPTLNLYGRIAVFNIDPLQGENPQCRPQTFSGSSCNADYFIGQTSTEILIELSPLANYSDLSYTLKDVSVDFWRNTLIGVDKQSNQVKVWNDFNESKKTTGNPPTYSVSNPNGSFDNLNNRFLPALVGLSSITVPQNTNRLLIFDSGYGRLYDVSF